MSESDVASLAPWMGAEETPMQDSGEDYAAFRERMAGQLEARRRPRDEAGIVQAAIASGDRESILLRDTMRQLDEQPFWYRDPWARPPATLISLLTQILQDFERPLLWQVTSDGRFVAYTAEAAE